MDGIDCGQGAGNLATDLEQRVYKQGDPDLSRSFADKQDKKKRDWVVQVRNCFSNKALHFENNGKISNYHKKKETFVVPVCHPSP